MGPVVRAWRPPVAGVSEVLHADFPDHAYPMHVHDTWTLLVVDRGCVRYALDRHQHATTCSHVTLLPPDVPHDGAGLAGRGFRKRVLYLDAGALGSQRVGRAVGRPAWNDPALRDEVDALHGSLLHPGDAFEAENRLALVTSRLTAHLDGRRERTTASDPALVRRLRELLDDHLVDGIGLTEAGRLLGVHPTHLVRAFSRSTGIAPHRYLTGRRLDVARRLLLEGRAPAEVAAAVGFHDQAHLGRHFKRLLGVTPAVYAGR
ncbi:AraC family transcriptional regulator [Nocardioides mangrovicus]|uniref:AraC family transcriptional regulator n=1 Tax=Nocardioides mangrovicus TaxID=2478913 RepID=A0A3L8P3U6_9ACTN|nr:AraC family transcriptional regulator [Nocardioides mangrovicus]RLV49702.1 AraC family transcriptional regulator [Nocardioides mangrovicus]